MQLFSSTQPLTVEELKQLDEFFSLNCNSGMNLTKANGFLCAILISPQRPTFNQWRQILLGKKPKFKTEEEIKGNIQLLFRFYNQIKVALKEISFEPLLWNNEIISYKKAPYELLAQWCEGFLQGAELDSLWCSEETAIANLLPFSVLAGQFDLCGTTDHEGNIIQDDSKHKELYRKNLVKYIKAMYAFWQEFRKLSATKNKSVLAEIISPNSACPCGGGLKYKNCCGKSSSTLH